MAVQIPFPLPATGYALNSKVRVNLDFIVDKFNEFNTGDATWDTVAIGTPGSLTGTLTFYNSTNSNYASIVSGVTSASYTLTMPTADADGVLMSDGAGTLSFDNNPNITTLTTTGNINSEGIINAYASFRVRNDGGYWMAITASDSATADLTWVLPADNGNSGEVLKTDGAGTLSWGPATATAASKALDNLASVAINTSLISDTTETDDLGSSSILWNNSHIKNMYVGADASQGYILLYSSTTLKGYWRIYSTDFNANNSWLNLTNEPLNDTRTFTIPEVGADANFVMTAGSQTVGGTKTFSSAAVMATGTTIGDLTLADGSITDSGGSISFGNENLSTTGTLAAGTTTLANGANLVLQDDDGGDITITAPAAVDAAYTLTLPTSDGDADEVLTTDGSGNLSWQDLTAVGGANTTLSNLSDPVAINTSLNDFTAGTITASLTGHASLDLPLTAGSGSPVTGDLYIENSGRLVIGHPSHVAWSIIDVPDNAVTTTWTLPALPGSTANRPVVDSDGSGALSISSTLVLGKSTGETGSLTFYTSGPLSGNLVISPTDNSSNVTTTITNADQGGSYTYTIPNAGASADFVMDEGSQTIGGEKTFSIFPITPSAAPDADYEVANKKYVDDATGGGSGASTALDNLAAVAINTSLIADTANTDDIGDVTTTWRTGYFGTSVVANTMTLATGSITDSSGAIDFGNENLSTTGTLGSGTFTCSGDISVPATNKIYLDGGSNTYISESAADTIDTYTAGNKAVTVDSMGAVTQPNQPSFLAYNSATDANVTGDGTVATVEFDTEVYDLNSDFNTTTDTFTAPVTGKYLLTTTVAATNLQATTHAEFSVRITTSKRTYHNYNYDTGGLPMSWDTRTTTVIADMDAGDTAHVTIDVSGSTKDVNVYGTAGMYTYFSGSLIN